MDTVMKLFQLFLTVSTKMYITKDSLKILVTLTVFRKTAELEDCINSPMQAVRDRPAYGDSISPSCN